MNNNLNLQLDPEKLDRFCKKILSRSRNTANSHEALIVLEAFITNFSSDSQGSEQYKNIQQCLKSHSEKTRDKLMLEKTQQLKSALIDKDISVLANIYSSLSRNGFFQSLATATDQINTEQVPDIALWVINWSDSAKQKAEQASGYPDALNFKKANINIEQYQSMTDISYFFNHIYKR